jgi:hypothetical protein
VDEIVFNCKHVNSSKVALDVGGGVTLFFFVHGIYMGYKKSMCMSWKRQYIYNDVNVMETLGNWFVNRLCVACKWYVY